MYWEGSLVMKTQNLSSNQKGFTLAELLVVTAIAFLILSMASYNLKRMVNPLQDSSAELVGIVKQAKAKAIHTSSAYKIHAPDNKSVVTSFAKSCSDPTFVDDATMKLTLDSSLDMTTSGWTFCFSPRGLADRYQQILIVDNRLKSKMIEVFRGGAVRTL